MMGGELDWTPPPIWPRGCSAAPASGARARCRKKSKSRSRFALRCVAAAPALAPRARLQYTMGHDTSSVSGFGEGRRCLGGGYEVGRREGHTAPRGRALFGPAQSYTHTCAEHGRRASPLITHKLDDEAPRAARSLETAAGVIIITASARRRRALTAKKKTHGPLSLSKTRASASAASAAAGDY